MNLRLKCDCARIWLTGRIWSTASTQLHCLWKHWWWETNMVKCHSSVLDQFLPVSTSPKTIQHWWLILRQNSLLLIAFSAQQQKGMEQDKDAHAWFAECILIWLFYLHVKIVFTWIPYYLVTFNICCCHRALYSILHWKILVTSGSDFSLIQ